MAEGEAGAASSGRWRCLPTRRRHPAPRPTPAAPRPRRFAPATAQRPGQDPVDPVGRRRARGAHLDAARQPAQACIHDGSASGNAREAGQVGHDVASDEREPNRAAGRDRRAGGRLLIVDPVPVVELLRIEIGAQACRIDALHCIPDLQALDLGHPGRVRLGPGARSRCRRQDRLGGGSCRLIRPAATFPVAEPTSHAASVRCRERRRRRASSQVWSSSDGIFCVGWTSSPGKRR